MDNEYQHVCSIGKITGISKSTKFEERNNHKRDMTKILVIGKSVVIKVIICTNIGMELSKGGLD